MKVPMMTMIKLDYRVYYYYDPKPNINNVNVKHNVNNDNHNDIIIM